MMNNLAGNHIKGYELQERIGTGGFGAVYRAHQSTVGREVAIKIILPAYANHPMFIRRFEAEAQLIARLEHHHIVPLYDYWRDPEGAYLVMRLLRGGSLYGHIQNNGALSVEDTIIMIDQITHALHTAHRNEVIHRDIKPGNILLDEDGNAFVADFGIAKDHRRSGDVTEPDNVVGSPDYLSPEQARTEPVTPQTDIYSLGVVLYEMLAGQHPFPGLSPIERLYKHLNEPLPELSTLDERIAYEVNAVIQKATAKDPMQRYKDVLEMAQALRTAAQLDGAQAGLTLVELLTPREQEVLQLIIEGKSNREIADTLVLAPSTVKSYVNQIYHKLNVRSRVQAIVKARELDLIVRQSAQPLTSTGPLPEPDNPYKGLQAFDAADALDFFGREKLISKLLKRLQEDVQYRRFLAVVGPSGSGKSSVVKAGLVPALWRGELPGSDNWYIVDLLPGNRPLDDLEVALLRVAGDRTLNLREQLERDSHGLVRAASLILPDDGSELLLVIDQFEEVFTLVEDEKDRQHFLSLLLHAVTAERSRVRILITLRADYYDRPLQHPDFGELIRNRVETVLPLSADELDQAIRKPAEKVGLTFEDGLVSKIVSDVHYQAGALPLLQYALTELFEHREGRQLTHAAYQVIGGTNSALANRPDEIYLHLSDDGKALAQQMFMRLVTLGEGAEDTRRRAPQSELLSLTPNVELMEEIIDQFAAYRLLSLDHDPDTRRPTVEVAHEAILREWERLRSWINDSRTELRLHHQLATVTADWRANEQDASYLLRGSRLEQFEAWAKTTTLLLTPHERHFLDASKEARTQLEAEEQTRKEREFALEKRATRVFQILTVVLFFAALGGIGLSVFAFDRESRAQTAREDAQVARDKAQELALVNGARAALASGDLDTALALGVAANHTGEPSSAAQVILSQAAYAPGAMQVLDQGAFYGHIAISSDGSLAIGGADDGFIAIWDLSTLDMVHHIEAHPAAIVSDVGISPDGQLGLSIGTDQTIALWDLNTGELVRRFGEDLLVSGRALTVEFSPDGLMLLSTNGGRPQEFADEEANLILWDVASGTIIREFRGHTDWVGNLAISRDGKLALSGAPYEELILWDMATGEDIRRNENLNMANWRVPSDIALRSDGQTALVLFADTTASLLDLTTFETIHTYGEAVEGNWWWTEFALSPDETTLYLDNRSAFWDVESGDQLISLVGAPRSFGAAASPNGDYIILGHQDATRIYSTRYGAETHQFDGFDLYPSWYELSPDGQTMLVNTSNEPFSGDPMCAFVFVDVATGEEVRRFSTDEALLQDLGCYVEYDTFAFSPDGQRILSGGIDGHLALWDVATGEVQQRFEGHTLPIDSVNFSPDGTVALSAACQSLGGETICLNAEIILWDISAGAEIRRFDVPSGSGSIYRVTFSPDGQTALSAHDGGVAILWDVASGAVIREFTSPTGIVRDAVFSPDGEQVLTTAQESGPVILWDVQTGRELLTMNAGGVIQAAFSADGDYAVLAGAGISLWDLSSGEKIRQYAEGSFHFIPTIMADGQSFLIDDVEHATIRQLRLDYGDELLAWTQANRYVRELSCIERETYQLEPYCEP